MPKIAGFHEYEADPAMRLLRILGFVAVALGLISIIISRVDSAPALLRWIAVPEDDGLGLIFAGFAVRMARLELLAWNARVVVRTSRFCLVTLGVFRILGFSVGRWGVAGATSETDGFASGVLAVGMGALLMLRDKERTRRIRPALTLAMGAFAGVCWVALLLHQTGMIGKPAILTVPVPVLVLFSSLCYVLVPEVRLPRRWRGVAGRKEAVDAARRLMPLALGIPVVLAVMRHQAERLGWIHPELGLLLHVLFSAGSMGAMIFWNSFRLSADRRVAEAVDQALGDAELHFVESLKAVDNPVWVIGASGELVFQNTAARAFQAPPDDYGPQPLGVCQQSAVMSASIFHRRVAAIRMQHRASGQVGSLNLQLLRTITDRNGHPKAVIVIAQAPPASLNAIDEQFRAKRQSFERREVEALIR